MELSIIIVNYNVKYFLEHCLLSVIKACAGTEAEILVVDNNSSDNSRSYLESKFPAVKFFWRPANTGFAAANNFALANAEGSHILFLNPDTIVPEDCFIKCLAFFRSTPDCGALGVRMIDGNGRFLKESKRGIPGPAAAFFKMTGLADAFPRSKIFASYYAGTLPENVTNKTAVLAGAFMMLSREATQRTKGFDEKFFMYGEDIDLSCRVLSAGLGNYYFAETTILHFKGESSPKSSKEYAEHFYGAMALFAKKHYGGLWFRRVLMNAGISIAKALFRLKNERSGAGESAPRSARAIILGNPLECTAAAQIMNDDPRYIIEKCDAAGDVCNDKSIDTIVFCAGARSYKEVIEKLQQKPARLSALFFSYGARSIIGSSDRNSRGIAISRP